MDKPYVIGIDMGGTNTVFGIVDARGHVRARNRALMKRITEMNNTGKKSVVKTWSRSSTIFPEFVGHTIAVRQGGRLCGCGRHGCLEAYASATGVARTAREMLTATDRPSLLRNIKADDITSKDVHDAALQGDTIARDIFNFTGRILGEKLADFVTFSAPEAIILFGGLTKAGDYIMQPIHQALEDNLLPIWKGKVKLLLSDLKEADAAVLGASALAWNPE